MKEVTGLIGRDDLVDQLIREVRKGKHCMLFGPVGVGKSAVLDEVARKMERRQEERRHLDPYSDGPEKQRDGDHVAELPEGGDRRRGQQRQKERRRSRKLIVMYLHEHQGKAQFVHIAQRLLLTGIVKPSALDLAKKYDSVQPAALDWSVHKRSVNRLSMQDISRAIIPAMKEHREAGKGRVVIFVDDMTRLTPTQEAFWLAVLEFAQVVTSASKKSGAVRKMWWQMKEIKVPPLDAEASTAIVREYIGSKGIMIEEPRLYVPHVVKQAGGNPQALHDMVRDSAAEKVISKQMVREMRHQAGIRYWNFTPIMLVLLACVVAARYVGIGTGDKELYVLAGIAFAFLMVGRLFLTRDMHSAN